MRKDIGRRWGRVKVFSGWELSGDLKKSIYGTGEMCAEFRYVCLHDGVPVTRPVRLPDIRHLSKNDLADDRMISLLHLVCISDEQVNEARALFNQAAKDDGKVVSFPAVRAIVTTPDPLGHQMAADIPTFSNQQPN